MPSYYYHLKFELYPSPNPTAGAEATAANTSEIWLPSADASAFDELPHHPQSVQATTKLRGRGDLAPAHNQDTVQQASKLGVIDCGASRAPTRGNGPKIELLSESRWLERSRASPAPRLNSAIELRTAVKDWRFGRVRIETVDPAACADVMTKETKKAGPSAAPTLGPSFGGAGTATKAEVLPRETKNTELGWGVVRFYRDGQESPSLDAPQPGEDGTECKDTPAAEACSTLCIPAVPAYMTPGDLMGFLGDRWMGDISHCRMVMTSKMNRYLILLKFRDGDRAKQWRREFDGKVFNSMEVSLIGSPFHSELLRP